MDIDRFWTVVFIAVLLFSMAAAVIQLIRGEDWLHALCFLCTVSIVLYIELDSYFIGFAGTLQRENQIILLIQRTLYFICCIDYGCHAFGAIRRRRISCIKQ